MEGTIRSMIFLRAKIDTLIAQTLKPKSGHGHEPFNTCGPKMVRLTLKILAAFTVRPFKRS